MGPIALFDKSFLQSLSLDESVWFDHFFFVNVCPIFYGETLADLDKTVREGRLPEHEVGIIADKFPDMHGLPCAHHSTLGSWELLGYPVRMTGQVPRGGRRVESRSGKAAVFETSPETDAFERWQKREFAEVERRYARLWRRHLGNPTVAEASATIRALGVFERAKNLRQAKMMASRVVGRLEEPLHWFPLVQSLLGLHQGSAQDILDRWIRCGKPPLVDFAPYTAYVVDVEVFFQIALASKLVSSERRSNRLDIAYLFYLPFCMMFVSNDRLHQRCAPMFLRPDQEFVWGPDLKMNLGQINRDYLKLPNAIAERGVYSLTDDPPAVGNQAVRKLWSRLLPKWSESGSELSSESHRRGPTAREIRELAEAPEMVTSDAASLAGELDQAVIRRLVKKKKGSWYQLPAQLGYQQPGQNES